MCLARVLSNTQPSFYILIWLCEKLDRFTPENIIFFSLNLYWLSKSDRHLLMYLICYLWICCWDGSLVNQQSSKLGIPYQSVLVCVWLHLRLAPSLSVGIFVCLYISLSLSFYPSHYMQHWGYLRDWASKEKISPATINDESDRGQGGRGPRGQSERERARETADDRWIE